MAKLTQRMKSKTTSHWDGFTSVSPLSKRYHNVTHTPHTIADMPPFGRALARTELYTFAYCNLMVKGMRHMQWTGGSQ